MYMTSVQIQTFFQTVTSTTKKKMVFLKLKNGNLESIIEMLARMKSTYAANRFDFVSKKIYNIYIL